MIIFVTLHYDEFNSLLMKPKILLLVSLIISIFLLVGIGCEKDSSYENLLIGSWTHSIEEQTEPEILIYRPTDLKQYPPSWYRNVFSLNDDNTCDYLVLAADDGHFFEKGTWNYNKDTKILTISYTQRQMPPHLPQKDVVLKFEVIELKKNMLKLKSVS